MIRVHGDKILRRRKNYIKQNNYQQYTAILKEDFQNMCGYCGKDFSIISCPAHKDHLIPKKVAENNNRKDLISSYENLVLSCSVCNRKKSDEWPFNNLDVLNDGKIGFVDPASDEFDSCLCRDEEGKIIAVNDIGKYMYDIFDFQDRLTEIWWKLSKLKENITEIDNYLSNKNFGQEEFKKYYKLHKEFDCFCELLKTNKEML